MKKIIDFETVLCHSVQYINISFLFACLLLSRYKCFFSFPFLAFAKPPITLQYVTNICVLRHLHRKTNVPVSFARGLKRRIRLLSPLYDPSCRTTRARSISHVFLAALLPPLISLASLLFLFPGCSFLTTLRLCISLLCRKPRRYSSHPILYLAHERGWNAKMKRK